jgi:hypothetical protein
MTENHINQEWQSKRASDRSEELKSFNKNIELTEVGSCNRSENIFIHKMQDQSAGSGRHEESSSSSRTIDIARKVGREVVDESKKVGHEAVDAVRKAGHRGIDESCKTGQEALDRGKKLAGKLLEKIHERRHPGGVWA